MLDPAMIQHFYGTAAPWGVKQEHEGCPWGKTHLNQSYTHWKGILHKKGQSHSWSLVVTTGTAWVPKKTT